MFPTCVKCAVHVCILRNAGREGSSNIILHGVYVVTMRCAVHTCRVRNAGREGSSNIMLHSVCVDTMCWAVHVCRLRNAWREGSSNTPQCVCCQHVLNVLYTCVEWGMLGEKGPVILHSVYVVTMCWSVHTCRLRNAGREGSSNTTQCKCCHHCFCHHALCHTQVTPVCLCSLLFLRNRLLYCAVKLRPMHCAVTGLFNL